MFPKEHLPILGGEVGDRSTGPSDACGLGRGNTGQEDAPWSRPDDGTGVLSRLVQLNDAYAGQRKLDGPCNETETEIRWEFTNEGRHQ